MSPQLTRGDWRLVDVTVAAVVAAALGVGLAAWNATYLAATPLFTALPPAIGLIYGVYLLPGVLVALIVRRPGAALFGGVVSALVSMLVASPWGLDALLSGAIQGGGAELVFAAGLYRWWSPRSAMLAAGAAGLGAAVHDIIGYYRLTGADFWVVFGVTVVISAVLLAGLGGWLLMRALARAGVLRDFPAGREQRDI